MRRRQTKFVIPDERSEDKPAPDSDPGESKKFKKTTGFRIKPGMTDSEVSPLIKLTAS
jgi:hypothetical protein